MLKITNPANGKVIREVEEDTAASVAEKVKRARAAQPKWAALPLEKRIDGAEKVGKHKTSMLQDIEASKRR